MLKIICTNEKTLLTARRIDHFVVMFSRIRVFSLNAALVPRGKAAYNAYLCQDG